MALPMDRYHYLKATISSTDPAFHSIRPERKMYVATDISATAPTPSPIFGQSKFTQVSSPTQTSDAATRAVAAASGTGSPARGQGRRRCPVPFGVHPEHRIGAFHKVSDLGDPSRFPPSINPPRLPPRSMDRTDVRFDTPDGDVLLRSSIPVGAQDRRFRLPDEEVLATVPVPAAVDDLFAQSEHSAPLRSRPAAVVVRAAVPAPSRLPGPGECGARLRAHLLSHRVAPEDFARVIGHLQSARGGAAVADVRDGVVNVGVLGDALAAVGYHASLDELKALRRDYSNVEDGACSPNASSAVSARSAGGTGSTSMSGLLVASSPRRTTGADIGSKVEVTLPVYRRGPVGSSDHSLAPSATRDLRDTTQVTLSGAQLVDVGRFLRAVYGTSVDVGSALRSTADAAGLASASSGEEEAEGVPGEGGDAVGEEEAAPPTPSTGSDGEGALAEGDDVRPPSYADPSEGSRSPADGRLSRVRFME